MPRFHYHKMNELEGGRSYRQQNVLYYVRRWLTIWSKTERELFGGNLEIHIVKPIFRFAWMFQVGNIGSETPFDGHITFFGSSIFWGLNRGNRLAQWLTKSPEEKYDHRHLGFRIYDGKLYFFGWVSPDFPPNGRFSKWRYKTFLLNPMDILQGEVRNNFEDQEEASTYVQLNDEVYLAHLKLRKCFTGRPKSKSRIVTYYVDVDCPDGIPSHVDHSGGWKGDRVYGFAVEIKNPNADWVMTALNLIAARIYKDRGDSGFIKADLGR